MKISMTESAKLLGITKQAVFYAIKKGRMKYSKDLRGRIEIDMDELDNYEKTRYIRKETTMLNGKKIFCENNYVNSKEAAKILETKMQHFYYLVRAGAFSTKKIGVQYLFNKQEILSYKEKHLATRTICIS